MCTATQHRLGKKKWSHKNCVTMYTSPELKIVQKTE